MAKKGLKRTPWTRRHAVKLFEKVGIEESSAVYRRLRKRWADEVKLPAELKVHIILGGAVCEWLEDLAQLQLVRCVERQSRFDEDSAIEKASSSLLPHLATDIGAILALCRTGYDVQARSLMRSFIEKLDILICVRLDMDFAASYLAAASFEDSRDFFYGNISGGKLSKKAQRLFREKFPDADFIHEWLFGEWRAETQLMLASAAHANHSVSMISLFPNLGRGSSDGIGFGGHPNNGSNVTIAKLLYACMPLHQLFASYQYDEVLQYLRDAKLNVPEVHPYIAYHGLLLTFPLVDTWLQNLDAAMQDYPPEASDSSQLDLR